MHILLGALLGAAAAAALQAVAVAWLVALLVGAALVGAVPVLIATIAVPPRRVGHWMARPAAQGVVLAIGTLAAIALSIRLLGRGDDVHFVRPLVPGAVAAIVDAGLLVVLGVRGARSAREVVRGADLEGGARSLGGLAARAVCRAIAVVVVGAAALVLLGSVVIAVNGRQVAEADGGLVVLGGFGAFLIGGLGCLFAWWGRRPAVRPGT